MAGETIAAKQGGNQKKGARPAHQKGHNPPGGLEMPTVEDFTAARGEGTPPYTATTAVTVCGFATVCADVTCVEEVISRVDFDKTAVSATLSASAECEDGALVEESSVSFECEVSTVTCVSTAQVDG